MFWAGFARPKHPTPLLFEKLRYFYQMGVPPVRVDILMGIPGGEFKLAWYNRNEVGFDGLVVPFISRQDLIDSKKASGRPQDLIDADLLSQVNNE